MEEKEDKAAALEKVVIDLSDKALECQRDGIFVFRLRGGAAFCYSLPEVPCGYRYKIDGDSDAYCSLYGFRGCENY